MMRTGRSSVSRRRSTCACWSARRSGGNAASASVRRSSATAVRLAANASYRARHSRQASRCGCAPPSTQTRANSRSVTCPASRRPPRRSRTDTAFPFLLCGGAEPVGAQECSQLPNRAEQMHAYGRFVQTRERADLARRVPLDVAQDEHRALPFRQPSERGGNRPAAFARQERLFGRWSGGGYTLRQIAVRRPRVAERLHPALGARPRLYPIQAPIDQDAREPAVEG